LDYIETLTGKVVGQVRPPFAIDANGVQGNVTLSWDGQAITFIVDKAWLYAPERAWPVTVDPTTVIQPDETSGIDAYIHEYYFAANYNTTELRVGNPGYTSYTQRALLKFDISTIPAGSAITSATLDLFYLYGYSREITISMHEVLQAW